MESFIGPISVLTHTQRESASRITNLISKLLLRSAPVERDYDLEWILSEAKFERAQKRWKADNERIPWMGSSTRTIMLGYPFLMRIMRSSTGHITAFVYRTSRQGRRTFQTLWAVARVSIGPRR